MKTINKIMNILFYIFIGIPFIIFLFIYGMVKGSKWN